MKNSLELEFSRVKSDVNGHSKTLKIEVYGTLYLQFKLNNTMRLEHFSQALFSCTVLYRSVLRCLGNGSQETSERSLLLRRRLV